MRDLAKSTINKGAVTLRDLGPLNHSHWHMYIPLFPRDEAKRFGDIINDNPSYETAAGSCSGQHSNKEQYGIMRVAIDIEYFPEKLDELKTKIGSFKFVSDKKPKEE